jgi:1-aminocyclopropane-1-carboxylate deaminase/D-cysteine desulfhydrase-like pyridoxal-dependent ACC family enzyme
VLDVPRVSLCLLPTPLHRLDRLSDELGCDLWIKRDDMTGFAGGGNKGRKLEYWMGQAQAMGATAVVSCGASQSNFIRQLGAACSVMRMRCAVVTMDSPYEYENRKVAGTLSQGGNVVLDRWFGIERRVLADGTWEDLERDADALGRELEEAGEMVLRIPIGGSSVRSAHAFVEAGREIGREFDWVVTASSSGSTQVGLTYAFRDSGATVLGVSADPDPEAFVDVLALSSAYAGEYGVPPVMEDALRFSLDYVGSGYGVASEAGDAAAELMGGREGILLDPIYSAKAFAGLLDLVGRGEISGRVLFWHTGGLPGLFALSR